MHVLVVSMQLLKIRDEPKASAWLWALRKQEHDA